MPTVDITIEHEVEVYCNECSAGLCLETTYTQGRTRGVDQFRVNPCPDCIKRKDEEIEDLQARIEELEKELGDA